MTSKPLRATIDRWPPCRHLSRLSHSQLQKSSSRSHIHRALPRIIPSLTLISPARARSSRKSGISRASSRCSSDIGRSDPFIPRARGQGTGFSHYDTRAAEVPLLPRDKPFRGNMISPYIGKKKKSERKRQPPNAREQAAISIRIFMKIRKV